MRVPPPPPALPTSAALRDPAGLPARRRTGRAMRVLRAAFLIALLGFAGVLLAGAIAESTGPVGFLVGLLLATLPLLLVVAAFLWVDRYEPEPTPLLAFLFFWGAVIAALGAGIVNSVTQEILAAQQGELALATTAVFVAPVVEETAKGAGILAVLLLRRHEFDGALDGVVAAGFVGVGFAFTENILYFGRAYLEGVAQAGPGGGVFAAGLIFFARGVLSPFAHPLFTLFTGLGLGVAVHARSGLLRVAAPLTGFACAVCLHAWWNFSAVTGAGGFLFSYLFFMVPLFGVAALVVGGLRAREGRLIARHLPAYVATGWLPAYDVPMVAGLAGRRQARAWARSRRGAPAERAMRDYQEAAAELAFLRDRAGRLGADERFRARESMLLAALARARAAAIG